MCVIVCVACLQLGLRRLEGLGRWRELQRLARRHSHRRRRQRRRRQLGIGLEAGEGGPAAGLRGDGEDGVLVREEAAEALPPPRVERGRVDVARAEEEEGGGWGELLHEEQDRVEQDGVSVE